MKNAVGRTLQKGFTLVELLIVVIILGILAAIVVPQLSSSTDEASEGATVTNLATMRSAIELYQAQHSNAAPGAVISSGGTCPGTPAGTAGTGTTANTEQALKDQLLMYTNAAGQACSTSDAVNFKYGPYLKKGIPQDKGNATVVMLTPTTTTVNAYSATVPNATGSGWLYNAGTGQIVAARDANKY